MRRLLAGLLVAMCVGSTAAVITAPGVAGAVSRCDAPNLPPTCGGDPRSADDPSGSFDQAVRWPGGILVSGWANDRNRANGAMTVVVKVASQSTNVTASLPRSDGSVGFQAVVFTSLSGSLSVCATAINVGAGIGDRSLGCRVVAVDHNPTGSLDEVTSGLFSVRVRGWAIDPDTANPISVHVYQDGAFVNAWTADASRTDVGAAYPGYGDLHGFDILVPYPSTNGSHTICVYGINTSTGTVNSQLGCRSWVEIHAPPAGPAIIDISPWEQTPGIDRLNVTFMDNSTDETRFDVVRVDPNGQATVAASVPGSTTTGVRFVDTGPATPLSHYCFTVNAYTWYNSSSSGTVCLTTPALPPSAPSNMMVTSGSQTTVTLSWTDNSTDEQGFELHHWVQGATVSAPIEYVAAHPGTGTVTATVASLTPGTAYCFQVTAYNQRSAGSFTGGRTSFGSNAPCWSTAPPNPPAAPNGLSITGHTQTSLSLGWTDNATDETGYRVDRQQGSSWVSVAALGVNASSFTHIGLAPGTTICYRVVAINAGGETPSGTACGTTDTPLPDLIVTNIQEVDLKDPTVNAGLLHGGDPFTMRWDICNIGADADKHETELDIWDGQSIVSTTTITVPQLAAGTCAMATVPFPSGLAAGQYDAYAVEDSGAVIAESNEANNIFKLSFNILT